MDDRVSIPPPSSETQRREHLERVLQVGLALGQERNRERLLERIVVAAQDLCRADGGTLYLRDDDDTLRFAIMRTTSLGIALGGTTGHPIDLPPVPMYKAGGAPNHHHVASHCALSNTAVNIPDAYDAEGFDFSGTRRFDALNGYRSLSFLALPMTNQKGRVIGVLQLINAQYQGQTVPFARDRQDLVEALSAQAAVALENAQLLTQQRDLMEAFIKVIAAAIDEKSPYTGGHCRRVPLLTEMFARVVCEQRTGPFADFNLSEEEWYALHIAGWLHDCGKVTTPVHVMDKATKLETIFDRIDLVRSRFAVLRREAEIRCLYAAQEAPEHVAKHHQTLHQEVDSLERDLQFLERINIGSEHMEDKDRNRVHDIAKREYFDARGQRQPVLTVEEVESLCVRRGTLTDDERRVINGHMVQTCRMLEALPFPPSLRNVPEYACGHHERMDGSGYPRGLYAGDMSVPARIMAIADVFEALTAQDRPYKKGKPLSETMAIIGAMKRNNHLDPDLVDVFVSSGVYRMYARRMLPPELVDTVDEASILAIKARPVVLPPVSERAARRQGFRPEYAALVRPGDVLSGLESGPGGIDHEA